MSFNISTCKTLSFACWNVRGIMSSVPYLCQLLHDHDIDICVITEHWLNNHNVHFFDSIDPQYSCYAKCDSDLVDLVNIRSCRGKGAVAIMWKKKLACSIKRVNIDDDRLLAIDVRLLNNKHLTIIGAYLPCSVAARDEFCSYTDKLNELISYAVTYSSVIILGDLNTQLNGTRFQCHPNFRTINIEAVFDTHDLFSLTSSTICTGPR